MCYWVLPGVTGCYRVSLSVNVRCQTILLSTSLSISRTALSDDMFVTSPVPQDYSHITTITRLCPRMSSSEKISNSLDFSCILETCLAKIGNCIREHFMEAGRVPPLPLPKQLLAGKRRRSCLALQQILNFQQIISKAASKMDFQALFLPKNCFLSIFQQRGVGGLLTSRGFFSAVNEVLREFSHSLLSSTDPCPLVWSPLFS